MFKPQKNLILAMLASGAASLATPCFAANPFITSIYTADPSAHVWDDGRLYVYPSRDIDPARGCDNMDRYHAFSTDDMVHWRDEGEILRASQLSWGMAGFMWAPDCAYKNGKYYFYFPHPSGPKWNNSWKIGVATSLSPVSGFTPGGYIEGLGGFAMIDPAVFVDTDGQAYLYYGGGGKCAGVKLKSDMTEIDGTPQAMTNLDDFHEATWVFKRNNIYYLTYADNNRGANRMRYATSSQPLGPWTYQGVYLQPTGCDTTHGSVVEYKGQWYQFYHNCSISGRGTLRSVCVDLLNFDADGHILQVVQTKTGPPAAGPAPALNTNTIMIAASSGIVSNGAAVIADSAAYGGECVHNLHLTNAYLELHGVDGGTKGGRASMDIHYASVDTGAKLRLTVNGVDYSYINTLSTGGWSEFTGDALETIPLAPGVTNVIRFTGGNSGVNLDYIMFTPIPEPPWNAQAHSGTNTGVHASAFGSGAAGDIVEATTDVSHPDRYYRLKTP